ncbi:hypothetical protein LptCag_1126 [Leptospirillum ferriphilum]|uniref:Uncharacterized protein n=1 Tax=Leptospirillum ferriphilum TaxID=178606 RepID=A0A094W9Y9_9BACT|nr:hypothetical protein LptCag_1126 [Leptospirillum ferriphilum]
MRWTSLSGNPSGRHASPTMAGGSIPGKPFFLPVPIFPFPLKTRKR